MYVHIAMSRDYVHGRGLRDVWASDATLIVRAGVQRRWTCDATCAGVWCGDVCTIDATERAGLQRQTLLAALRIIYPYEEMRGVWTSYMLSSHCLCWCDALGVVCIHVRAKLP
ncbi:hypothetical protein F2Q70_00012001 [Brassica cretica]|uniref:Uncharacterized protein n=1 Tax=Brassica cretica TaxID=69181 RepID=A0A8S9MAU0_BRACR|nr:hypothetical protein F2Q70_00012001 [Brassica cretica]